MNKLFSRIIVGALAITMATGGAYGATSADSLIASQQSGTQSASSQLDIDISELYNEGQAIVLFKPYEGGISAKSLDDEFNITDTLEFVTGESDSAASLDSAPDSGEPEFSVASLPEGTKLHFALVESDKLTTTELIEKLKATGKVEYAVPNVKLKKTAVDNDMTGLQWALDNTGQGAGVKGAAINANSEWKDRNNTGDKEKVVAVVDTGIDYTHPDLAPNMWHNPYQPALKGEYGYDFGNHDDDPMDLEGHGTHCAGIIGAAADGSGTTGICPDVSLMGLKIFKDDDYTDGWVELAAYEYISKAQDLGVNVVAVNNSYGVEIPIDSYGEIDDDTLQLIEEVQLVSEVMKVAVDTVGEKGAVSLFAAGNSGLDNDDELINYPAQVDSDYSMSVAAATEKDELAYFSVYGNSVDIAAPGTDILSTVSYPCYNPGIYDSEELAANSAEYTDFSTTYYPDKEDKWNDFITNTRDYLIGGDGMAVTAELTDEEYFGNAGDKSLKITVKAADAGKVMINLPEYDVSDYAGSSNSIKKLSMMVKMAASQDDVTSIAFTRNDKVGDDAGGSIVNTNCWGQFEDYAVKDGEDISEPMHLTIALGITEAGEYSIYIDDYGISKTIDESEADTLFGKYAYYNGTSMASPYVAGAAALLASARKSEDGTVSYDAYETIDAIYSHMRKGNFDRPIATGSSIDLSVDNPVKITRIGNIALNDDDKAELSGRLLGKVTKVEVKKADSEDDEYKSVDFTVNDDESKAVLPELTEQYSFMKIDARITYDDDNKEAVINDIYLAPGRKYDMMEDAGAAPVWDYAVTDGNNLYTVLGGSISMIPLNDNPDMEAQRVYTIYSSIDAGVGELMDAYGRRATMGSNMVVVDGKLYVIVNDEIADSAYTDGLPDGLADNGFYSEYSLMKIDPVEAANDAGYKPEIIELDKSLANLDDITLAAYNGKLMCIGGYDYNAKKPSTNVVIYSPADGSWAAGTALPEGEGRAAGEALQTDSGLVFTLGYSEAQKGVDAKEQKCPANLVFDGTKWTVSSAELNLSQDPYELTRGGSSYNVYVGNVTHTRGGLVYVATPRAGASDTFTYSVRDDEFASTEYNMTSSPDEYVYTSGVAVGGKVICQDAYGDMYEFATPSGFVKVKDLSSKGGAVSGTNRSVVPGGLVTLKASANKGYYVKSLYINGKKTNGKSATIRVTDGTQTAKAVTAKYVTKIKLNKTKLNLKAGKTYKLKATVYPKDAGNRAVRYTTSNKRYATVSSTGKVKALKAGKGKNVTIRVIAKDGSGKQVSCKVKIK